MRSGVILLLTVLWAGLVSAQPVVGVFAGAGSTTLKRDSPSDGIYVPETSTVFGGVGYFQVHPEVKLSLQPSWTAFRGQIHFLDTIEDEYKDSVDFRIDFISLAVLFKALSEYLKWQFSGGLEGGYAIHTLLDNGFEEDTFDSSFKRWNLVAVFAFGYLVPIGKSNLGAAVDFNFNRRFRIPLGAAVGFKSSREEQLSQTVSRSDDTFWFKLAYTGSADFSTGIDIYRGRYPLHEINEIGRVCGAILNSRFYFN